MEWKLISVVAIFGFSPLLLIVLGANLAMSRLAQELTTQLSQHANSAGSDVKHANSYRYVLSFVGMEALYVYALYATSLFLVSAIAYSIIVPYSQRPLALRRIFRKALAECRWPCTEWFYFISITVAYVLLFLFLIGAMAKALFYGAGAWAAHSIVIVVLMLGFLIRKLGLSMLRWTMQLIEKRYYGEGNEQEEDEHEDEQEGNFFGFPNICAAALLHRLEKKILEKIFKMCHEIVSWLFNFDLRQRIHKPETKATVGVIAMFSFCIGKLGYDICGPLCGAEIVNQWKIL